MEVIFELLIFGIIIGLIEDLLVVKFATGHPITLKVVGIAVLVTVPFAILGEVVFDNIDFAKKFERWFGKKSKEVTEKNGL